MKTTDHKPMPKPVTMFTQDTIVWEPWLAPIPEQDIPEAHKSAFKSPAHIKSPYFRLLARDVPILEARSKTDQDIFHTVKNGLPRAERELAAVAVSRKNGCIYCASVHARFASTYSKQQPKVDTLLQQGLAADLGERWNALVAASAALTDTPATLDGEHISSLRHTGFSDLEIFDIINAAAFFNWANRLMLTLGEPGGTETTK